VRPWITGVTAHHAGTPEDGDIAAWEDIPRWVQTGSSAVCRQVVEFIEATDGGAVRLSPDLNGRFVAIRWIGQIYAHHPDPEQGQLASWDQLPPWQQKTDLATQKIVADTTADETTPIQPE